MKYITLSLAIFLSACTLQQEVSNEWNAAKNHSYLNDFREAIGLKKVLPTPQEKMQNREAELCIHEDAHEREITANGINDSINYRYCTLAPLGHETLQKQRWNGR